jgi:hypothetical protein
MKVKPIDGRDFLAAYSERVEKTENPFKVSMSE